MNKEKLKYLNELKALLSASKCQDRFLGINFAAEREIFENEQKRLKLTPPLVLQKKAVPTYCLEREQIIKSISVIDVQK